MNQDFIKQDYAEAQDAKDKLKFFREEFYHPQSANGNRRKYFCGHSLGLQPKRVEKYVNEDLKKWQKLAVRGHFSGDFPWMPYHEFIAPLLMPLVGAQRNEVVCMNSLTANLHFMMVSFFNPNDKRYKILIEADAFPSDRYAVTSQLQFHNLDPKEALIEIKSRETETTFRLDDILSVIEENKDSLALILLPGVQYYTGQVLPIAEITKFAHRYNIKVGFDLAHAAGNLELDLHAWGVDFACWCHYKYLNSGPGAVGGCFVHEKHVTDKNLKKFLGWWGHNKQTRFTMPNAYESMQTAESWQLSNPPIISLCAIRASLEIFQEAGIKNLRIKSKKLTAYLENLIKHYCSDTIKIITPDERGCQLSLKIKTTNAQACADGLDKLDIDCDFRYPDVIRVAPVPLYNSFTDVWDFVNAIKKLV